MDAAALFTKPGIDSSLLTFDKSIQAAITK
jgi:hypothetical protein